MKDINLMPEEMKPIAIPKRETSESKKISIKTILILVGILIVVSLSIISPKIYVKNLEIKSSSIQADIASDKYIEVNSINTQINSMQATLELKKDVINDIYDNEVQVLDVINYIQEATPKGLYINGIDYDNKSLVISGTAKDSTTVAEYLANLSRFNAFREFETNTTFSYDKANVTLNYKINFSKTKQGDKK